MLSGWQWAVLLAIPPAVVLLYFLKLKRQPLEVPSTYLWKRSVEDLHVNTIWQRLRQNLLLFLQLLLLLLVILALLRPTWQSTQLAGDRFIFLIDNSASMSATDVQPTRLEEAKRQARALIDQMSSGDVGMIVTFADDARIVQQFTDDRRELRRRLDTVQPTQRSTSLEEALRVATGLAGAHSSSAKEGEVVAAPPATLYVFSDGKFPDVKDLSLGSLTPEFREIGKVEAANVAIAAFEARRNEEHPEQVQAFARLENFSDQERKVTAELFLDSGAQPLDAREVTLPPGGSSGVELNVPNVATGSLRLHVDTADDLAMDNDAWTMIQAPRRAKILLVTPGNERLETALITPDARKLAEVSVAAPDVLATPAHQRQAQEGDWDLIIYDRCQPAPPASAPNELGPMPQANTWFIGAIPPGPPPPRGWGEEAVVEGPQIIDVDRVHPLMQLIELGDVIFGDARPLVPPSGATVLVDTNRGPLLAIAPRERFEDLVLGAPIVQVKDGSLSANTTWPLRVSFPLFALNAVQYLGGADQALAAGSPKPGQPVSLRAIAPTDHLDVRAPGGETSEVRRSPQGTYLFPGGERSGVYEVAQAGQPIDRFAVNLFDGAEADLRPRANNEIRIGHVDVKGQSAPQEVRVDGWKLLLLLALGVLVFEWYVYNRRVYF